MRLTKVVKPRLHASDAVSIGIYDMDKNDFNRQVICSAGMDEAFFPEVLHGQELHGETVSHIPVSIAIGDNQASFLGSAQSNTDCILVNIGTWSQISLFTGKYVKDSPIVIRPYTRDGYLLVGSPFRWRMCIYIS